jgi:penicillin-binding protein-related factor A (putative recombinase)
VKPIPARSVARTLAARAQGAIAHAAGAAFEDQLEAACQFYRGHALVGARYVSVHRFPGTVPAGVIARGHPKVAGRPGSLRYVAKGAVDFVGCYTPSAEGPAVPLAFDAKVVTGDASFSVAARDRHQLDFLLAFRAAGGFAAYVLHDQATRLTWVCRQLEALAAGERVAICARRTVGGVVRIAHHSLPVLQPSALLDVAAGRRPALDVLALIRELAPATTEERDA